MLNHRRIGIGLLLGLRSIHSYRVLKSAIGFLTFDLPCLFYLLFIFIPVLGFILILFNSKWWRILTLATAIFDAVPWGFLLIMFMIGGVSGSPPLIELLYEPVLVYFIYGEIKSQHSLPQEHLDY